MKRTVRKLFWITLTPLVSILIAVFAMSLLPRVSDPGSLVCGCGLITVGWPLVIYLALTNRLPGTGMHDECGFLLRDASGSWICPVCRYDLTGLKPEICPECGEPIRQPWSPGDDLYGRRPKDKPARSGDTPDEAHGERS